MNPTIEELKENFELLADWEDRYQYLIELGRNLRELSPLEQSPAYKVSGCISEVWLIPHWKANSNGEIVMDFSANSNTMIVKGLLAILLIFYNGKTAQQALNSDAIEFLKILELDSNITAQRSNGLKAVIQKIKHYAQENN